MKRRSFLRGVFGVVASGIIPKAEPTEHDDDIPILSIIDDIPNIVNYKGINIKVDYLWDPDYVQLYTSMIINGFWYQKAIKMNREDYKNKFWRENKFAALKTSTDNAKKIYGQA